MARELVGEFAQRFQESHGIQIRFTDEAADRLAAQAAEQGKSVREICATRFKDFHFGLKLIVQNSGPKEFVIDQDVVDTPDKVLSDWVVASYRSSGQAGGTTP